METRIVKEDIFYRIYDRNGNMAVPRDEKEASQWLEKGKAPFDAWKGDGTYNAIRVWRSIARAERVTIKVTEEIEALSEGLARDLQ